MNPNIVPPQQSVPPPVVNQSASPIITPEKSKNHTVLVVVLVVIAIIVILPLTAIILGAINLAHQKASIVTNGSTTSINSPTVSNTWVDPKSRFQVEIPETWKLTSLNQGEDVAAISGDGSVLFFVNTRPAVKGENNETLKQVYTKMGYKVSEATLGGEEAVSAPKDSGSIKGRVVVGVYGDTVYGLTFGEDSSKALSLPDKVEENSILNSFKYLKYQSQETTGIINPKTGSSDFLVTCKGKPNDFNPTIVWSAYVSGGKGSYVYRWSKLGDGVGYSNYIENSVTRSWLSVDYKLPGAKTILLSVSDSVSTATTTCSAIAPQGI